MTARIIALSLCCQWSPFAAGEASGPWDLDALSREPTVDWIDEPDPIGAMFYPGEPYRGKATRVFAYYGRPKDASAENKKPAMVLVHGGGGKAFREWVELWVERGYVAIAMDLG